MNDKMTDRRVKYTKMVLRDALVELMQKQHISQISIKALCELADVNRSTFYAHYTDQYDLLAQVEQEVLEKLKLHLKEQDIGAVQPISEQVFTKILDYVKDNADLFKALMSENCDTKIQKDIMVLTQLVTIKYKKEVDSRTKDYLIEYGINGCISILQKWLRDGMVESTEALSKMLLRVLYYGTGGFQ